ncbi:type I polyketide synthase [Acidobacterium sp. S8]|uniref:type I polyketide synthase n=1 Tax=Acidobacterium sp. S8 TaxID=1641854 RepID=UPI00131C9362|nr:type I polyketide synthase [Acidobacterium sp. S8]
MRSDETSNVFLERIQNLSPKRLALLAVELERRLAERENAASEPIAVVGMACRTPGGAETPEDFWKILATGQDAIERIPDERWNADAFYDSHLDTPGKAITKYAGFVRNIDQFDPAFFGISPREASGMDPQHRMLLEVAWEALENAGERADLLEESSTGVFIGISSSDYEQLVFQSDESALNAYSGSGLASSVAAGRLSHFLGLHGPNLSVDTACSASGSAIHLACQSLRTGECSRALAGGVNLVLMPGSVVILSQAHMLAADGRCKTFSRNADGFGRAEGCGILVLKRLSAAQANGDRILGLIRGTAINHDGRSNGLTAPNGPAQEKVIKAALAQAKLTPADIDYVEAHGTGTVLGDAIELGALSNVFGEHRDETRPLLLGSVKTNVGHLESAAGVTGVMKILLALEHELLPPHLHLGAGDENEALQDKPFEVPSSAKPWLRSQRPRIAGVSSFGFSGTNCHLVIQEAPAADPPATEAPYAAELLTISAKTPAALTALCERYARYLREHPETVLADFSWTLNGCRSPFQHRIALIVRSVTDATGQLEQIIESDPRQSSFYRFVSGYQAPSIAFLFTGQGSQFSGMGHSLYERNTTFRSAIDRCDKALAGKREHQLSSVIFGESGVPSELIDDTKWTQPALFAVEYALAMLWESWGLRPTIVQGHSLGEYVAACVAGILTLEDALMLAAERGRLMSELPRNGGMLFVRASEEVVLASIGSLPAVISIAASNGPESVVLSGRSAELNEIGRKLSAKGIKTQPLTVSHAFHSPMMEPMLDEFERQAANFDCKIPEIEFVSNVTGGVLGKDERIDAAYWRQHVRQTVKFAQGLNSLLDHKPELLLEIGPSPVLLGMAKAAHPELTMSSAAAMQRGKDEWVSAFEALRTAYLAGVPINWAEVYRDRSKQKLALPTYPFQRQRYWATSVPRATSALAAATQQSVTKDPLEPLLYRTEWVAMATPSVRSASGSKSALIAGEGSCLETMKESLSAKGIYTYALKGDARMFFAGSTSGDVQIGRALIRDSLRNAAKPDVMLLMLPNHSEASDAPAATLQNATAILTVLQEVMGHGAEPPDVWLITQGAFVCGEADNRPDLAASIAEAMAKVARLEHPGLRIHHADLASDPTLADYAQFAGLLRNGTTEHTMAIRGNALYVPRLARYQEQQQGLIAIQPHGAYLVTGAFGGLGLRTAEWLVERGAKEVYLVGRREPSPATRARIEKLAGANVRVHPVVADISKAEQIEELSSRIAADGAELRGIVHAAGTLDDGTMTQQTPERFATVFAPKVSGGWLLHQFSLKYPLDFFVMFGSASALLGLSGQSNYAAANAFLDSLAELRHQRGLPATSVAWGAWSDIGMATRVKIAQRSTVIGIGSISPDKGMELQEQAILSGMPALAALPFDWKVFFAARTAHHDWPLLEKMADNALDSAKAAAPATLASLVLVAQPGQRLDVIRGYLRSRIASVLMLPSDYVWSDDQPFAELGLDSLMALELKNELQTSAGAALPPTYLFEYPNLSLAAMYLDALIAGSRGSESTEAVAAGYEEIVL